MSERTPADVLSPGTRNSVPGLLSLREVISGLEAEGVWPLSPRPRQSPLQSAWVELIARHDWQWFGTYTFREAVHPEKADKLFRLWCALLDESHLGPHWHKKSKRNHRAQWVRGLEWQKRGVLHYHALIRNIPPYMDGASQRLVWGEEWNRLAGIARIHPVADIGGAAGYISKYCAKGGQVDICDMLSPQTRISGPHQ